MQHEMMNTIFFSVILQFNTVEVRVPLMCVVRREARNGHFLFSLQNMGNVTFDAPTFFLEVQDTVFFRFSQ